MEKNIFIFDYNQCVGCHACVVACMNENGFQHPETWRNIHPREKTHLPQLPLFYLSLACNHCDEAPCLKNCPASAYSRDERTGGVIHHPEKCMGCQYCTWACPYDAPKFYPLKGIIEKCTFCNHRIEKGEKPACANLCPTGALDFMKTEFTREESVDSNPGPVDVGANLRTIPLRKKTGPEMDLQLFDHKEENIPTTKKPTKISAITEWPLVIFTLIAAGLMGIYSSGATQTFTSHEKHIFFGSGIIAGLLSIFHLGKKLRAWRSFTNLKNSWLSREILFFSLFIAALGIDFYVFAIPGILVSACGLLLLFSIDKLYHLATWKWPAKIHSAQTLFISITLFSLWANLPETFYMILFFRLLLYIYRKIKYHRILHIINLFRIGAASTAIILLNGNDSFFYIFIAFVLGEIIDRIEFYNELNVPSPENEYLIV
ncbi:MAG: DmsC/YnfH family molybdoenzyme membrane anchor subunit [Bacteroidales bacterium]|jgi:Fe-S-cluster-containing dehydrogenase component/DMSO reductase anchor subunit|nr:DmsC/YnfH family molybdoenzyme membrane anchor subunit [Bacteroidales bacterium]